MSQSWKRQGSSFNNLVKAGHRDTLSNPFDRHIIQTYELPDSSGSGQVAQKSFAQIEFNKFNNGENATNQITFENIWAGIDASASIVFEDVSGGLGFQGMRFLDSKGDGTDISQNIFLTDTSGESILFVLDVDLSLNIINQPIYEEGPFDIGCPSPPTLPTDGSGGTLGRIRVQMGKITSIPTGLIAQQRALQFSSAINDFVTWGISGESLSEINDASMCLLWQTEPPGNTSIIYKPEPINNPLPTDPRTPISHWESIGPAKWEPDFDLFPDIQDGSFNSGRSLIDRSQKITLKDTSGETLQFFLDVSGSLYTDISWNQGDINASLGKVTVPMGEIWFEYPTQINQLPSNPPNSSFHPNKTDRAKKFIEAVNKTWGGAPSENYIEIKAEESTDVSGVVNLRQIYGGTTGNNFITYDPSFNVNTNSVWLPTSEISDPLFNGGTTEYDISQNIIFTDGNTNILTFHLNVDLSMNDINGNYHPPFIDLSYNIQVQMDGSLLDETNNIHNRITGVDRATHFRRAINNAPIISGFPSSWAISAIRDASTVTITQEFPGVSGNGNISYDPSFAEIFINPNPYPICSTARPFPDPSGFVGGIDPIDLSQNIILQAYESPLHPVILNGEPAIYNVKVLFLLDIAKDFSDPIEGPVDLSGSPAGWPSFPPGHSVWTDASFVYGMAVPMGKGVGHSNQEIGVSDASRAYKFKKALTIAASPPPPGWTPGSPFIGGGVGFGIEDLIVPNPDNIPPRSSAGKLIQYREGAGGNLDISYNPNPNYDPLAPMGNPYDNCTTNGLCNYPLKEKLVVPGGNEILYNFINFQGGQDFLQATDKTIRTKQNVIIRGGRHIAVLGDQSSNTIFIASTQSDESQAPVWTSGKGAGTANSATYSIQARNPGMDTGLYGAGASYSVAAGLNTKVTGVTSACFGKETNVGGQSSFAAGELNIVPSSFSIAAGYKCSAYSNYSTAFGYNARTGTSLTIPPRINAAHQLNNVVFAIGSGDTEPEIDASGTTHYNIMELDTCGNIWTKGLGNMKYQEVQWLRDKFDTTEERTHTGLYIKYEDDAVAEPQAKGNRALAAGYNTYTDGNSSFVDGSNCRIEAGADFSAVFGENNIVKGNKTHCFVSGKNNIASGKNAAIFGADCSGADYTLTSGYQNYSIGNYSTTVGSNNVAQGPYSIALGAANYAYGESSISLGRNNRSIGFISSTIGCHCEASGNFSIAIGRDSTVTKDSENSIAIGYGCDTSGVNSFSLGSYSRTDGSNCLAAIGGTANANYSIAIGKDTITSAQNAISIGRNNKSIGEGSITLGYDCSSNGNYSFAIGKSSTTDGSFCFAGGDNCRTYEDWAFAFGKECDASGIGSFAAGIECKSDSVQNNPLNLWPLNLDPSMANPAKETLPSIALGFKGSTSLFAPWRNGIGAANNNNADWGQTGTKPGPKFRQYHKGIILAVGASGESTIINEQKLTTDPFDVGVPRVTNAPAGNIFELYGDGSIWTPDLGLMIPPLDASASKWEYYNSGGSINDSSSALISRYRNNAGAGKGAFAAGENCIVDGSYSFCVGTNNKTSTEGKYAVAMGVDCSGGGEGSLAMGKNCDASNAYSVALGCNASTRTSNSGRVDPSGIIFALGTCEDGNIFEVDASGGIWSKQIGKLETSTPALGAVPIGGIIPYAGSMSIQPPANWLWCDGYDGKGGIPFDACGNPGDPNYTPGNDPGLDHVQYPEYEALFVVIGQTYGTKKNGTGFRVPNLEQRYPLGLTDFITVHDIGDGIPTVEGVDYPSDSSGNKLGKGVYHGALMRYIIRYK